MFASYIEYIKVVENARAINGRFQYTRADQSSTRQTLYSPPSGFTAVELMREFYDQEPTIGLLAIEHFSNAMVINYLGSGEAKVRKVVYWDGSVAQTLEVRQAGDSRELNFRTFVGSEFAEEQTICAQYDTDDNLTGVDSALGGVPVHIAVSPEGELLPSDISSNNSFPSWHDRLIVDVLDSIEASEVQDAVIVSQHQPVIQETQTGGQIDGVLTVSCSDRLFLINYQFDTDSQVTVSRIISLAKRASLGIKQILGPDDMSTYEESLLETLTKHL